MMIGMTYSTDFRRLAFTKYQSSGGRLRATARVMEISPSTLHRWKHESWWGGTRRRQADRRRRRSTAWTSDVRECVLNACRACDGRTTVRCLRDVLERSTGRRISDVTIRRGLTDAGYVRRRVSTKVLGSASYEDVSAFRTRFNQAVGTGTVLVSVDESHFSRRVVPLYAYRLRARKAERITFGRGGGWISYSLLHAIASDGTTHSQVIKGSVNRQTFCAFVSSMPFPAGSVLLLDNCAIHKNNDAAFAAKTYTPLFLSPYSPQFQPVELAFSVIKSAFRRNWPTPDDIPEAVMTAVKTVSPEANKGFIRHAVRLISDGTR